METAKTFTRELPKQNVPLSPRTYLSTLLLAVVGGPLGLRHFYLGFMLVGWVRLFLFVTGIGLLVTAFVLAHFLLGAIGVGLLVVSLIWSFADVFTVYKTVRRDADDKAIATSIHDKHWAALMVVAYVFFTLLGLVAIGAVYNYRDMLVGKFIAPQYITVPANTNLTAEQKNQNKTIVIANYEKLQVGQTKAEVATILGIPPASCTASKRLVTGENCLYGSYASGYVVFVAFEDNKMTNVTKYEY